MYRAFLRMSIQGAMNGWRVSRIGRLVPSNLRERVTPIMLEVRFALSFNGQCIGLNASTGIVRTLQVSWFAGLC